MSIKKEIVFRMGVIYLAVVVFAIIIVGRILQLQIVQGEGLRAQARTVKASIVTAKRGDIVDRNGKVLATSVPYYHIYFDPRIEAFRKSDKLFTDSVRALSNGLSKIFDNNSQVAANRYYAKLSNAFSRKRMVLIKRNLSYPELKKIKALPILNQGPYRGGLVIEEEDKRVKPYKELAYRTLGYMYENSIKEKVGMVGLERAYEVELRGEKGYKYAGTSNDLPEGENIKVLPKNGHTLVTTLDVDIQDIAHSTMLKFIQQIEAKYGCAIVMEVKTGDVLAIANIGRNSFGQYTETYNYAIGRRAEPGSTFKIVSMMVALDDGVVKPGDSIETGRGVIKYYDKVVRDWNWDKGGNGKITVREVIKYSSNVGISKIIYDNYNSRKTDFVDRIYSMNLNQPLGVEIKGEKAPFIKYPGDKAWSGITLPQMAFGYEVELTPLQILTFFNAIANNGKMLRPRFAKALKDRNKIVEEFDISVINASICQDKTVREIQDMLESVVEDDGTAEQIQSPYYKIAGKTGTAQIAINNRSYKLEGKSYHRGSFCGYFPADDPKYSCIVVIDSSANQSVVSGGRVAMLFKEISDKIFANDLALQVKYMDEPKEVSRKVPFARNGNNADLQKLLIKMDLPYESEDIVSNWVIATAKDSALKLENRLLKENIVPNVKGMGLRDALFILEKQGLQVDVKGYGIVRTQSLRPGELITKGDKIIIELG